MLGHDRFPHDNFFGKHAEVDLEGRLQHKCSDGEF